MEIKHKAKILTPKEVEEGRSSAYEYLNFENTSNNLQKQYKDNNKLSCIAITVLTAIIIGMALFLN